MKAPPRARQPRNRVWYVVASLALLAPCGWQSRIQAGDLSSHIYNAWLAGRSAAGQAPGVAVVRQATNVLFDIMLGGLLPFGAGPAQRIAVAAAVLIFAWGAFAFVRAVAGYRPWFLLPALAMLSYGWVFHMGFCNFYLSLGLCFWALALLWEWKPRRRALAAPVLLLAFTAHALPVAWALGAAGYLWLARRLSPRRQAILAAVCFGAIAVLSVGIRLTMRTLWSPRQLALIAGADQVWLFDGQRLFDSKYVLPLAGLLLAWILLAWVRVRDEGARRMAREIPFQIWFLTAAGVFLLPTAIVIPGFRHALAFVADRMALAAGILVCALLGSVRPPAVARWALAVSALIFFGFLYRDDRLLNQFEDGFDAAVAQLPPGQRVIGSVDDLDLHMGMVTHMIDRACIGRCFSYANYEPSTGQFRVRAAPGNRIVAADYVDSWRMQVGRYVVRESDLPLYQVVVDGDGGLSARSLPAGTACGLTTWKVLPDLF